jgi:predicted Zn-dependent protease
MAADSLPDLSGQPPWVIVVVAGLTVAGSIAGAILQGGERRARKKRKREIDNDAKATAALPQGVPSSSVGPTDVLHASVTAIIEQARRESAEAVEARAETRALRARYEQAMVELEEARRVANRANADLGRCRAHVEELRTKLNGGDRP